MPKLDRKDALWLLLLILLVLFFFRPFVLRGRIPLNADWLHANFYPGRAYLPNVKAHNSELDDPVYQFYPLRMEAVEQWKSGRVPLWNPKILCGSPLLADGISKPFDPLIVLWLVFGGPVGHSLELLAQFMLMITGMYVLARALGLPSVGAAVAAVVYTFNLLAVTWMELRTATGAFAFFPWAFLTLVVALDEMNVVSAALSGLFAALMEFAGHPQFVFYGFAVLSAFVLLRTVSASRSAGAKAAFHTFLLGFFAISLGVALCAVEVIPFLELAGHSARNPRQYEMSNLYATPLSFLTYFYPNFLGSPSFSEGYVGGAVFMRPYMTAAAGFVGMSTIALVPAGLFLSRFKHKRFVVFVALAVFFVLIATGIGLGQLASFFTFLLAGMDVARIVFISNFAFAIIAGAGAGALAAVDWRDVRFRRLGVLLVGVAAVLVVSTVLLRSIGRSLTLFDREQALNFRWAMDNIKRLVGNPFWWPPVYSELRFFAFAIGVVFLAPWLRRLAPIAALALVTVELLLAGIGYNPFVRSSTIAPPFDAISAVKCSPADGRILGVDPPDSGDLVAIKGDCLVPNTAMLYGFADIRGDESLRTARYQNYVLRIVGIKINILASIHFPYLRSPFIDALNVRYFLSATPLKGAGVEEVFADGKMFVYRNLRALPRAWLVGKFENADSATDALNGITEHQFFDFANNVVLEPGHVLLQESPTPFRGGSAEVATYLPTRVEIRTDCPQSAILVLSDAYYHGWGAEVDGLQTPIMPANGVMRAVVVPEGAHSVVFTYRPASFRAGLIISSLALAVLAGVLVGGKVFRRPKHSIDSGGD